MSNKKPKLSWGEDLIVPLPRFIRIKLDYELFLPFLRRFVCHIIRYLSTNRAALRKSEEYNPPGHHR